MKTRWLKHNVERIVIRLLKLIDLHFFFSGNPILRLRVSSVLCMQAKEKKKSKDKVIILALILMLSPYGPSAQAARPIHSTHQSWQTSGPSPATCYPQSPLFFPIQVLEVLDGEISLKT